MSQTESGPSRLTPHASRLIRQCCRCRRVWDEDEKRWVEREIPEGDKEDVTHGLCDVCYAKAIEELETWEAEHEKR